MTYIELINEFWKQNGFMSFGVMDTAVYSYLLHQCNIRGWHNPFQLQTRDIEFHLSITRKQIGESKNRLKNRGLIDFTAGSRKGAPTYTIIGLSKNMFPSETQTETQTETQIKTKTKDKDIKENPLTGGKRKANSPAEQIREYRSQSENDSYLKFLDWIEEAAPYVSRNINPLSEVEFEKLKSAFGSKAIMVNIQNIENRKDLRKKYTSLYRTLLNWCKNGYNE